MNEGVICNGISWQQWRIVWRDGRIVSVDGHYRRTLRFRRNRERPRPVRRRRVNRRRDSARSECMPRVTTAASRIAEPARTLREKEGGRRGGAAGRECENERGVGKEEGKGEEESSPFKFARNASIEPLHAANRNAAAHYLKRKSTLRVGGRRVLRLPSTSPHNGSPRARFHQRLLTEPYSCFFPCSLFGLILEDRRSNTKLQYECWY